MQSRKSLLIAGMAAVFAASTVTPTQAIHQGERAPFRAFEFMVSLRPPGHPNFNLCGGTMIAPDIVLTAAHCVHGVKPTRLAAVVGTDTPQWRNAPRVPITGYRVSPGFSIKRNNRNDLALLRLATPQDSPVIALASTEPKVGAHVAAAGWGCTDRPPKCRHAPTHLREAQQRVVRDARCDRSTFFNPPAHLPTSICAKGLDGVANSGDSGGPLVVGDAEAGFTQVGVVSLLSDRRRAPLNAYASVPAVRGWIDRATAALSREDS